LINNTFVGAGTGNAITINNGSPAIINNIIASWSYGIVENNTNSDPDTVAYNLFFDNRTGLYYDEGLRGFTSLTVTEALLPEVKHNLAGDPKFVDANNNDYHLLSGSPAINAGDPNSPLDPDGTRADVGAFYFHTTNTPPATPKNLQAAAGDKQVTLTWTANSESNFLRYRIYSGISPNPTTKIDSVNGVANTTKTITGLTNGTTYYFRITAVNNALQESGFSNEVSAQPVANRPPVVVNPISNQPLTVGGASFTRNLNATPVVFNDPDGDTLRYTASSSATNIATVSISGSTLTVLPAAGGSATITVTANDGKGGTVSTSFSVTVNRPPVVANTISNQTLQVGGSSFTRDLNTSPIVFSDPDGDVLSYTASSNASSIATANISGSTLTVAPLAVGSATITVTANDNKGGTVSTTFTVTVGTAPNRPPVVANAISNQTLTVGGATFTRDLNAVPTVFSDPDGDALAYTATSSAPNNATASISNSILTVAPVSGGVATITITANDGKGGMISTNFTVTVNRPPVVANLIPNQALTVGGSSFTRILNASPVVFNDLDLDPLGYTASSNTSSIATASISASTLTVAPVAVGNASITVTANDNRGGSAQTTFTVTVNLDS